jgi:hypothetical protein
MLKFAKLYNYNGEALQIVEQAFAKKPLFEQGSQI